MVSLLAFGFLVQVLLMMQRPSLTYRALDLGMPEAWIGVLGGMYAVAPLLIAVAAGHATDRYGQRVVMACGAVVLLAGSSLYVVANDTLWGILGVNILLGIGTLFAILGQEAMIATRSPRDQLDANFGHMTFVVSVGQIVGPLLMVLFSGSGSSPDVGVLSVVFAVLTALLLIPLPFLPGAGGSAAGSGRAPDQAPRSSVELLRAPHTLRVITISCVVISAVDLIVVFLPAIGQERGIAAGVIGTLLAVRGVASMVVRLMLNALTRRFGRNAVLSASLAIAAAGLVVIAIPLPVWLLGVAMVAVGVGLGAGQPLTLAWLAEVTPSGSHGKAMSLRLTGNRLGQVCVPVIAGGVATVAGAGAGVWLVAATVASAGWWTRDRG